MSFTQPDYIKIAFAQDGDKSPIGNTPSILDPSQPLGFPEIYETPLDDGGEPITREQFNGIINLYSEFILWNNVGGCYEWNADIATIGYPLNARIWYNGDLIRSTIPNNTTEPSSSTVSVQGTDWVYVAPSVAYQLPVGSLIQIPVGIAPIGYILANGSTVSRTTYANLFAVYGTTFGAGDGSTTFALPDFRGKFIRGQGGNSATYGVTQNAMITDHNHITIPMPSDNFSSGGQRYPFGQSGITGSDRETFDAFTYDENLPLTSSVQNPETELGNELRPINLAVDFYIKY